MAQSPGNNVYTVLTLIAMIAIMVAPFALGAALSAITRPIRSCGVSSWISAWLRLT